MARYTSACSNRPSSKAAASEGARHTRRYVEPLSDARTPLEDCFSILLDLPACNLLTALPAQDFLVHDDRVLGHGASASVPVIGEPGIETLKLETFSIRRLNDETLV